MSQWIKKDGYEELVFDGGSITIEPRPSYCDRGDFLAKLHVADHLKVPIDKCDGWPRYYFGEPVAKGQIDAWLIRRRLSVIEPSEKTNRRWMVVGGGHGYSGRTILAEVLSGVNTSATLGTIRWIYREGSFSLQQYRTWQDDSCRPIREVYGWVDVHCVEEK